MKHVFVVVGILWVGAGALANEPSAASVEPQANVAPDKTGTDHHVSYTFSLTAGGSFTFAMPIVGYPVRLGASLSGHNGGLQTPTALISVLIAQDSDTGQLTWLSTNGDGSVTAGNTITGGNVAGFAYNNAILTALPEEGATMGQLTITQSTGGSGPQKTEYRVTMDY